MDRSALLLKLKKKIMYENMYENKLKEIQRLISKAYELTTELKEAAYEASYKIDKNGNKIQAEAFDISEALLELEGTLIDAVNSASERGL